MSEIKKETVRDQNYLVCDGTWFSPDTDPAVMRVLNQARKDKTRIRIFLGDTAPESNTYGKIWPECYDVTGYVGRSMGSVAIPLLLKNSRSMGGGAILCGNILKITNIKTKACLYQHPNAWFPLYIAKGTGVYLAKNNEAENLEAQPSFDFSSCKDGERKAQNMASFLMGNRDCP